MFLVLIVRNRGRTIRKVPCLDLSIKQLRRVGKHGETARGSEKETKPCGNCRDLFCLIGDPPVAGTKVVSVVYLLPDHPLQGKTTLAARRKLVRQRHFAPHGSHEMLEGASE